MSNGSGKLAFDSRICTIDRELATEPSSAVLTSGPDDNGLQTTFKKLLIGQRGRERLFAVKALVSKSF